MFDRDNYKENVIREENNTLLDYWTYDSKLTYFIHLLTWIGCCDVVYTDTSLKLKGDLVNAYQLLHSFAP